MLDKKTVEQPFETPLDAYPVFGGCPCSGHYHCNPKMKESDRELVLAMARHEFSDYTKSHLWSEYERKKLAGEYHIFGYVLTEGDLLALFKTLADER